VAIECKASEAAAGIASSNTTCLQACSGRFPAELIRSLQEHIEVVVMMRDSQEAEELKVVGTVECIDQQGGRFRVDGEWFNGNEIEAVYLKERS